MDPGTPRREGSTRMSSRWWPRWRHSASWPSSCTTSQAPCCARPGRRTTGGLEVADLDDPAGLLVRIGGRGANPVLASAEMEGLAATIVGDFDGERGVTQETSTRAMHAFAGLLASRIALEGARRRAEDARARMASLVERRPVAGPRARPRRPADPDRAVGADGARRPLRGARRARRHRDGAGPVRHGRDDGEQRDAHRPPAARARHPGRR